MFGSDITAAHNTQRTTIFIPQNNHSSISLGRTARKPGRSMDAASLTSRLAVATLQYDGGIIEPPRLSKRLWQGRSPCPTIHAVGRMRWRKSRVSIRYWRVCRGNALSNWSQATYPRAGRKRRKDQAERNWPAIVDCICQSAWERT